MVEIPILITFAVLIAAIVLFVLERVPPSVTSLGAAAVLMITGVVTVQEGLSGFSNEATITVLGMLVLAAAVNRTGLILTLAHKVLDVAAGSPRRFLLLLIAFAAGASAFLANTPIVAMMIPLVITVAARLNASPSRFLMPMAYATTLGGMITVIGTSTTILASSISERMGFGHFGFFEFTPVGLAVTAAGGAYLFVVAPRLLPERHPAKAMEARFDLKSYLCEILLRENSPLIGQRVEESNLKVRYDIDFLRIVRGDRTIEQPLIGVVLQAGDVVQVRASRDEILKIRDDQGIDILQEVTQWLPAQGSDLRLAELVVAPGSILEGSTLSRERFRGRYDAVVLAVRKREHAFLRRLSTLRLEAGDTLLISAGRGALDRLKMDLNFIVTDERESSQFRRDKLPIVVAIFLAVILAASLEFLPIAVAAVAGVVLLVVTGSLHVEELQDAVPWHLVFLLAGLIPLGIALEKTGAAALVALGLERLVGNWPPMAVLAFVYATTLLLTEVMSNNASVAIMIPLGVELARALALAPYPFLLAATFAASLAFMAPIGYQTYLMVYGPGEYRFMDFIRVGGPLNLLCMAVALVMIQVLWPLT